MEENNQEFTDNSYRVFRGLQNPSDQKTRHSRHTVPPTSNYATIPWRTFRKSVYEDVHVFMGKRTAYKATGFSPDPETEDKATMTGSDEEDEDDDLSKRRRNILEEDLNITFEVELDSGDDEDDFRPKVSSTDPTLRVDFKIIRKHSSQSANNTEMDDYYTDDEKTKFDPQKESSVCVADGNHEMSDEMFEVNNENTPVSLADVIADILDSEQESRLYKALMGGDTVDKKVISEPEHAEKLSDIGGCLNAEKYDDKVIAAKMSDANNANASVFLGEVNAGHLTSEQVNVTYKELTGDTRVENNVATVAEYIENLIPSGDYPESDKTCRKNADEVFGTNYDDIHRYVGDAKDEKDGAVNDDRLTDLGIQVKTVHIECEYDVEKVDEKDDMCKLSKEDQEQTKYDVIADGKVNSFTVINALNANAKGYMNTPNDDVKSTEACTDMYKKLCVEHDDGHVTGLLALYTHGQCNFVCRKNEVKMKYKVEDDDEMFGILGAFARE